MWLNMQTQRLVSGACTVFVFLTLAACNNHNQNISQLSGEQAHSADGTRAKVEAVLHDFFDDIDSQKE